MRMKDFIIKCCVVTLCVTWLLYLFFPRYEFTDATHVANRITGKIHYYTTSGYSTGSSQ